MFSWEGDMKQGCSHNYSHKDLPTAPPTLRRKPRWRPSLKQQGRTNVVVLSLLRPECTGILQ